ncbi:MAG: dephospho-CoA kinase [Flavobacteriales bacterium]|nr:dephospho-CoA kinase [Flavobacteriales bacterium]
MLVVGLTGGIGSGKSTVARKLSEFGALIYYTDDRAKSLMVNSSELRDRLIDEFGKEVYINEGLNRKYLSSIVFSDKEKLKILNSIVHPIVAKDFDKWVSKQNGKIVIKEAAILFESGAYKTCDVNISISADLEERISRVIKRDGVNRNDVVARINNQWTDSQRNSKADIVFVSPDYDRLDIKVEELYIKLLALEDEKG